jgi:hypothetical protein
MELTQVNNFSGDFVVVKLVKLAAVKSFIVRAVVDDVTCFHFSFLK